MEELYKQTLQTLLTEACEDMHYFHSNICSPDTKVERVSIKTRSIFFQLDINTQLP